MQRVDYQIVPYRPEHKNQVIDLQKNLWSPSAELNAAYLDWKHLRNPYVTEPLIYLAMQGAEVVGMRGFFGTKWQFGLPHQELTVPCAGDMLIAPNHRNRGLMTQIMKAALKDLADKGYDYVISMSAGSMTLVNQMAMGWRSIGSMQRMRYAVSEKKSLPRMRAFLKKTPLAVSAYKQLRGIEAKEPPDSSNETPVNLFDVFDAKIEQSHGKFGAHVSMQNTPRPQDMADLVARAECNWRIRHVQDETYFDWRFKNPRNCYRFLFWDDNMLQGFLVLQASRLPGDSQIKIVDWKATTLPAREELLRAVIDLVGNRTLSTWSATLGEENRQILDAVGFKRVTEYITNNPSTVVVRPVRDELLDQEWLVGNLRLLDLANWDLRMIYSEGF